GEAVWLNPNSGVFADIEVRRAIMTALDRKSIVDTAWGGLATVPTPPAAQCRPPPGTAPSPEAARLQATWTPAPSLAGSTIDLAWAADGGAPRQQMAELIQSQLAALGLDVTVR
ncbi:ABC transporter substrate-binding protein, partial [Mycobacterium sp. ITM-2017-0098]